ncbi:hypothetical protein KSP39_PZI005432 [Platanthera zijinensis]|uniref:Uncharacterized protein n=1 Tax=Platanthera zijinensis TaxID=2320716 RepID=A0AAP0BT01_9ASPA
MIFIVGRRGFLISEKRYLVTGLSGRRKGADESTAALEDGRRASTSSQGGRTQVAESAAVGVRDLGRLALGEGGRTRDAGRGRLGQGASATLSERRRRRKSLKLNPIRIAIIPASYNFFFKIQGGQLTPLDPYYVRPCRGGGGGAEPPLTPLLPPARAKIARGFVITNNVFLSFFMALQAMDPVHIPPREGVSKKQWFQGLCPHRHKIKRLLRARLLPTRLIVNIYSNKSSTVASLQQLAFFPPDPVHDCLQRPSSVPAIAPQRPLAGSSNLRQSAPAISAPVFRSTFRSFLLPAFEIPVVPHCSLFPFAVSCNHFCLFRFRRRPSRSSFG